MDTQLDSSTGQTSAFVDASAQQVAAVYAKAYLDATDGGASGDAAVAELESLVSDVLDKLPALDQMLSTGLISTDEKLSLIDRTLSKQASPKLLNFLKVLAGHNRLDLLRAIAVEARAESDRRAGRVNVEVTTAVPLDEKSKLKLTDTLRGLLKGEPILHSKIDSSLIAGIVLRIGDTVYDGSVATHLARVRQQMVNRSIHEIQSRRDRFGT
jgi:F-type H+-transporting ATPase subunit delta